MRRLWVLGLACFLVGMLAAPAAAGSVRVNAAHSLLRSGSSGPGCEVVVDHISGTVEVSCGNGGSTWFRVGVGGIGHGPLRATALGRGDCSGKAVKVRRANGIAYVRVRNAGVFDCTYRWVTVRW